MTKMTRTLASLTGYLKTSRRSAHVLTMVLSLFCFQMHSVRCRRYKLYSMLGVDADIISDSKRVERVTNLPGSHKSLHDAFPNLVTHNGSAANTIPGVSQYRFGRRDTVAISLYVAVNLLLAIDVVVTLPYNALTHELEHCFLAAHVKNCGWEAKACNALE